MGIFYIRFGACDKATRLFLHLKLRTTAAWNFRCNLIESESAKRKVRTSYTGVQRLCAN
jgi:hypothetical protein